MGTGAKILLERAYRTSEKAKGYRVLVDRVWPRGVPKTSLKLDSWAKDVAPSAALRRWFGHDPQRWDRFRRRYLAELRRGPPELSTLLAAAKKRPLVLIYGAKDERRNQATVLRSFLLRTLKT